MDVEEAKRYLSRIRYADAEIKTLLQTRRVAWDLATATTSQYEQRRKKATQDPHGKFERLAMLDDVIDRKTASLYKAKAEAITLIGKVSDPKKRIVLEKRFINGEDFEEIADSLYYSDRGIYRICKDGLKEIADIYTKINGG